MPFGGILLVSGVVLLAAAAFVAPGFGRSRSSGAVDANRSTIEKLRAVAGLAAVGGGIAAVIVIGLVTVAQLEGRSSEIVAIATAAFGVISALVGAYLGIRVTAEQSSQARQSAEIAHAKLGVASAAVGELEPEQGKRVKREMEDAGEEAVKTVRSTRGRGA